MSKAWKVLSALNVNEHVKKKGNLTYLSWTWAWGTLLDHFPESNYEFLENEYHADGSVTVHVALTVDGITRKMWLPVMDNRNNAVKNPNARAISDSKMRCLVKAAALFGIGHYIFAGEDVPSDPADDQPLDARPSSPATYDNEKFHQNLPAWEQALSDGKITKEGIIARIESKAALTDAQRANIMGLGEHA